jgi:hypothetical protein
MHFRLIELEHVITCTFGCMNGEMHVESFSDDVPSVDLYQDVH